MLKCTSMCGLDDHGWLSNNREWCSNAINFLYKSSFDCPYWCLTKISLSKALLVAEFCVEVESLCFPQMSDLPAFLSHYEKLPVFQSITCWASSLRLLDQSEQASSQMQSLLLVVAANTCRRSHGGSMDRWTNQITYSLLCLSVFLGTQQTQPALSLQPSMLQQPQLQQQIAQQSIAAAIMMLAPRPPPPPQHCCGPYKLYVTQEKRGRPPHSKHCIHRSKCT